jgi:spore maturation protein CgeB
VKLVIFGLSVSSAWGNGHATLWRGILRTLAADGHEVVFFERDTPFYADNRDLPHGSGYEIVIYPSWPEIEARARREVESADASIVTSYQPDAPLATEVVASSRGARIFYDLDTPVTLDLLERGQSVPWLPNGGLGMFDLVLSFTGGAALEALVTQLGARKVAPLYGCVDRSTHHPVAPRADWSCDLSYLGTYAADRQESVERLFFDVATQLPKRAFLLGGPMYPVSMHRPPNVVTIPHVPPADHAAFYCSSRCTLNLTRAAMKRTGFCPSARLFEAAACGVPIISDAWEGLDRFFEPDREIVVATTTAEAVRALSADDATLRTIASRARERTLETHSAEHRAKELLELIRTTPRIHSDARRAQTSLPPLPG